jgi:uncharacterized protein YbjT (DUF2867 family)
MSRLLLVAGASGALGARAALAARARGWRIRALTRDRERLPYVLQPDAVVGDGRDPAIAAEAVAGVDAVFSAAGASVSPALGHGWRGYRAVDGALHRTLIAAAAAAHVGRFVYVSVFHPPALRHVAYVAAHEEVVDQLRAAAIPHAVIRPTGFFSAVGAYLDLARRGPVPEIGRGDSRTNPIDDDDLAEVCVHALEDVSRELELAAGGPDVVTRRTMAEQAFAALGLPPRFRHIPVAAAHVAAAVLRPFHPRLSQLASFVAALAEHDVIAPVMGTRRLADDLASRAAGPGVSDDARRAALRPR